MAIEVALNHHTKYTYDKPVKLSPQTIRLRPAPHTRTPIKAYSLNIEPKEHFVNWQQDPFGNYLARVVFHEAVKEFQIDVEVIAEMKALNAFDFFIEEDAMTFPFEYEDHLKDELSLFLKIEEEDDALKAWVEEIRNIEAASTIDFLVVVNYKLYERLNYNIRLETGIQSCETTLTKNSGSCRDFAWVLIQALRHLGLATRFVSGYLVQLKSDQLSLDGPSGPEEDFTDLHAWCEVYLPGAGWVGLDATSGLFVAEGHIPLCCTPSPASAAPLSGYLFDKVETSFDYSNKVTRIHEDPRVTKPYDDEEWGRINALGEEIDEILENNDARLTMGGEPTFVSRFDMESEQWNTEADGYDKRKMAYNLSLDLKKRFGKDALIHVGQGKWYPGEPIPRWEYNIYWRKDGLPLVRNSNAYAHVCDELNYDHSDAERLINAVGEQLRVPKENIHPAYEDVFYYLWQENQLPVNIDPLKVDLRDSLERRALSDNLNRGLNNPAGFVIPIEWNYATKGWLSCAWEFRHNQLYLKPGNSPMGLRLPLDALPHMVKAQHPQMMPRSPFEEVGDLTDFHDIADKHYNCVVDLSLHTPNDLLHPKTKAPNEDEELSKNEQYVVKKKIEEKEYEPVQRLYTIITAISIEPRDGKLFVFFPPLQRIEQYLELQAVVEKCAVELGLKIIIEGYKPPYDNRIERLVVTPDPGVVEVNIHPAKSWKEVCANYETLFAAAGNAGLGTEKFMMDGRHTGSGGGHHVTLGGITPAHSPLLRRPDVLKSMLIFWQNHPGLSYLFSTAFIGPTSQAPRVDEGKLSTIYDLEIALNEIQPGVSYPYWKVDRLLRNLLTDITGNTHRSEFCIDKLYSPDSSSGRLGILELRGFEMPPEKKMCLVQLLLVRALFAKFWMKPNDRKLIKWGAVLHDKYMMHHWIKEDLEDICEELQEDGLDFKSDWLSSFFEFRFPLLGRVTYNDITLELRLGIEPWQVLGEEMGNNGMARFVDSSTERIEVKVMGINPERYSVLCNGNQIPLVKTRKEKEYVAGIRYKAWAPPSALHPSLGIDTPLTFDIYDTWNRRSVGGCQYHVYHPGGRSYDTYPVNAVEAESRRENRFTGFGHTPTQQLPKIATFSKGEAIKDNREIVGFGDRELPFEPNLNDADQEFAYTLDLRKV